MTIPSDIETLRRLTACPVSYLLPSERAAIGRVLELLDEAMQLPPLWGWRWSDGDHTELSDSREDAEQQLAEVEETKWMIRLGKPEVVPLTLAAMIADKEAT